MSLPFRDWIFIAPEVKVMSRRVNSYACLTFGVSTFQDGCQQLQALIKHKHVYKTDSFKDVKLKSSVVVDETNRQHIL